MSSLDELAAGTVKAFQAAALGEVDWETPVRALAEATNSMGAQLIGLGPEAAVPFNIAVGGEPGATEDFVKVGGGDPLVNSRVRIGSGAAELAILDETAFTTAADMRLNPDYGDWIRQHRMDEVTLTTLVRDDDLLVGMAVMRTERQGPLDERGRRIFAAVAPHARRAAKTRIALGGQRLDLMIRGLTATRTAAFVCDSFGRVRAMTPAAETIAAAGQALRLAHGRLTPRDHREGARFQLLLNDACHGGGGPMRALAVHDADGGVVLVEAAPIPRDGDLAFGDCALVIVHQPQDDDARLTWAAQALYGLSPSEGLIAGQLATGRSVTAIAEQRQTYVSTVRSQVRRVFEKAGVSSQVELVASLARFR